MKALRRSLFSLIFLASAAQIGCATAKLEPKNAAQKVPNKPNAARMQLASGVVVQAEANAWMADERVKNEVTAMKVTIINRSPTAVAVDYGSFVLAGDNGKLFKPVPPEDISIRGARRSIGLPADAIITRSSDSAVNAPNRTESEKQQIRERLEDQSLRSENVASGERTVGYVYFQRVPATVKSIIFRGSVRNATSGEASNEAELEFQPREYQ